jgi:hypothetical protein
LRAQAGDEADGRVAAILVKLARAASAPPADEIPSSQALDARFSVSAHHQAGAAGVCGGIGFHQDAFCFFAFTPNTPPELRTVTAAAEPR